MQTQHKSESIEQLLHSIDGFLLLLFFVCLLKFFKQIFAIFSNQYYFVVLPVNF